ncbi:MULTISPECIES: DNA cytosine methyltransferase [unclassified Streptomyces]|uniref:DNA cytosine methyltransferase n=1 Tax=unclassified Streptomyces TaxID=2593676 RepID=UPI00190555B7|nr:DNA cytosine methyltransferase [Streptomyces sp. HSG2]
MQPAKIVDLFAGPGGVDVAAETLGVPSVGLEWDPDACRTRRAAGLATIEGDVRRYGPADFPDADVLAGGPPCQTFTVAGNGAGRKALEEVLRFVERMTARDDREAITGDLGRLDDERTGLVLEPLRWILEALDARRKPYESIVLEQVPAVLPVWEAYARVLRREGYSVAHGVVTAEAYGVPQTRRRAVLVARRGRHALRLPEPTHRAYRKGAPRQAGEAGPRPWRSMGEVVDRGGPFEVVSNYGTGGDPRQRGRRSSSHPAATVTGKIFRNRVVSLDGEELERFSPAEAGRLQTFPSDYPWSGRDVGQQIGNAVPPRLAMHVLSACFGWSPPAEEVLARLDRWVGASTVVVGA